MKANNLREATSKSAGQFIGLCLYLFGTIFIGIFPDKAREILGDKIVAVYNYFSISGWVLIGVLIFVAIFIFNVISVSKKETSIDKKTQGIQVDKIEINQIGNSNVGKQSAETINNFFGGAENSKKDVQKSSVDNEKIVFHRMYYHEELIIEGSSPEQIISCIVENVASSLWYIHTKNNTVAYDLDHTRTKAYNPSIDNTDAHGIIFGS